MNIVATKCPACGASIQLDGGFCNYCGAKIKVQEAVSFVKVDNGQTLENLIHLANNALIGNNGEEAFQYANKALEIDATISEVWLIKMHALDLLGTLENICVEEIIVCGTNAIYFSNYDDEVKKNVYNFYIGKAGAILNLCIKLVSDTEEVKELNRDLWAYDFSTAKEETYKIDKPYFDLIDNCAMSVVTLKEAIPAEMIAHYSPEIAEITKQYVFYNECCGKRLSIYGFFFTEEAMAIRKELIEILKYGLPEYEKQEIQDISIEKQGVDGVKVFTIIGAAILFTIMAIFLWS